MRQAFLTTLLLTALLASCAINPNLAELNSSRPALQTNIPKQQAATGGAATRAVLAAPVNRPSRAPEYRLGFGDVLEVKFFNNSEYNETTAVRPDGKITLQRIGDISVVGMRVSQLDSIITASYAEILVHPDATVFVREFGGQFVYVMGEVQNPGSYAVTKGLSLLRAITTAGGPLHSAKMNSIILVRGDEHKNLAAERFDLSATSLDKLLANDTPILPYDLVYVPKTFVSDLEVFLARIYQVVMPPLDLAARFQYYSNIR